MNIFFTHIRIYTDKQICMFLSGTYIPRKTKHKNIQHVNEEKISLILLKINSHYIVPFIIKWQTSVIHSLFIKNYNDHDINDFLSRLEGNPWIRNWLYLWISHDYNVVLGELTVHKCTFTVSWASCVLWSMPMVPSAACLYGYVKE